MGWSSWVGAQPVQGQAKKRKKKLQKIQIKCMDACLFAIVIHINIDLAIGSDSNNPVRNKHNSLEDGKEFKTRNGLQRPWQFQMTLTSHIYTYMCIYIYIYISADPHWPYTYILYYYYSFIGGMVQDALNSKRDCMQNHHIGAS